MGCTFFNSRPCDTPCEIFSDCKTGVGALASPPIRFGGGALDPVVAIPIMLGAGASVATGGGGCTAGAVPPCTTRGATSALLAADVLLAAVEAELGAEGSSLASGTASVLATG